jgi:hypothetical protein
MRGPIPGKPADPAQFAPFHPATVLYELDTPRIFTLVPADGELYLAHWFDESETAVRYLIVPFSAALQLRLTDGRLSLRDALDQPRLWAVDVNDAGELIGATRTTLEDLPADELPAQGTLLTPALESRSRDRSSPGSPAAAGS